MMLLTSLTVGRASIAPIEDVVGITAGAKQCYDLVRQRTAVHQYGCIHHIQVLASHNFTTSRLN